MVVRNVVEAKYESTAEELAPSDYVGECMSLPTLVLMTSLGQSHLNVGDLSELFKSHLIRKLSYYCSAIHNIVKRILRKAATAGDPTRTNKFR